jgi:hypothetical protein
MSGILLAYSVFVLGNPPSPGLIVDEASADAGVALEEKAEESEPAPLEERPIAYVISEGQALTTEGPMYMGPGIYMNHPARIQLLEHVARQESLIDGLRTGLEGAVDLLKQEEAAKERSQLERNICLGVGGALALTVIGLLLFRR